VYILTFFILVLSFAFPWLEFFFLEFNVSEVIKWLLSNYEQHPPIFTYASFVTLYSLQYLPKEIGKYSKIDWLSWKAWLWPRKLPLNNNDVVLEESTPIVGGMTRSVQEPRRTRAPSMNTSVFVTPRTSPPRESVIHYFN